MLVLTTTTQSVENKQKQILHILNNIMLLLCIFPQAFMPLIQRSKV